MKKFGRIGAMVGATVVATGMAMTMTAAPAAAARPRHDGPKPVSNLLQRVDEGQWRTVSVWFKTDEKICDFKLHVWDTRNVDVRHFQGNGWYSSLNRDDSLHPREIDYASFRVRAGHVRRSSIALLPATIYYNNCGRRARTQTKNTAFVLPIRNGNFGNGGDNGGWPGNNGGGNNGGGKR